MNELDAANERTYQAEQERDAARSRLEDALSELRDVRDKLTIVELVTVAIVADDFKTTQAASLFGKLKEKIHRMQVDVVGRIEELK